MISALPPANPNSGSSPKQAFENLLAQAVCAREEALQEHVRLVKRQLRG